MMNKKIIFSIFLVFLLSISVFAGNLKSTDYASLDDKIKINKVEDSLKNSFKSDKLKELKEKGYEKISNVDLYDVDLQAGNSKIKLKKVKNPEQIFNITIKNSNNFYGSDVLTISEPDLAQADIVLEKYIKGANVKLLYASDNINFIESDINYTQNDTHIIFSTNHFSSWTSSFPDLYFFPELDTSMLLNLYNFIDANSGDYFKAVYYDFNLDENRDVEYIIGSGYGSDFDDLDGVFADGTPDYNMLYNVGVGLLPENPLELFFTLEPASLWSETQSNGIYNSDIDFRLYNSADVLQDLESLTVYYDPSFDTPDFSQNFVTSISETSATIVFTIDYNDLTNIYAYDPYISQGEKKNRIAYRVDGASTWDYTPWSTSYDGYTVLTILSDLVHATTYEYRIEFDYYDPIISSDDIIFTVTNTFDTDASIPEVSILSVSDATITSGQLNAIADFNGYSGTVTAYFEYKLSTASTWLDVDAFGQIISDGVIYTDVLTGLTTGLQYDIRTIIEWSGGSDTSTIKTFTPQALGSGDLTNADVSNYWNFDDASGDLIDSAGNDDGTNFAITYLDTGISSTYSYLYDGATSKTDIGSGIIFSGSTDWTLDGWFNSNGATTYQRVLIARSTATEYIICIIDQDPDNTFRCTGKDGTDSWTVDTIGNYDDGNDHYFVLMYDYTLDVFTLNLDNGNEIITSGTANWDGILNQALYFGYDGYTNSQNLNGNLDEFGYYDSYKFTAADINMRYGGANYPFVESVNPTVETLSVLDVTSTSANLRLYPNFNGYAGTVTGYFQYKETSDTEWIDSEDFGTVLSDQNIYSFDLENLYFSTAYDYKAVIEWSGGSAEGLIETFSTDNAERPTLEVRGPVVSYNSATFRGELLGVGDYNVEGINVYWKYKLSSEPDGLYSDAVGVQNITALGVYEFEQDNLLPETEYQVIFFGVSIRENNDGDLVEETLSGGYVLFNTTVEGQPVLSTLPASSITRTSATITGEIVDLSSFESLNCYFDYYNDGNQSNTISSITTFTNYENTITLDLEDLFINTTYYYYFICENVARDYLADGGIFAFTTLSLDDDVPTYMLIESLNIDDDSIEISFEFDNADNIYTEYKFNLYSISGGLIKDSITYYTNSSEYRDYTFSNLDNNKYYEIVVQGNNTNGDIESNTLLVRTTGDNIIDFGVPTDYKFWFSIGIIFTLMGMAFIFLRQSVTLEPLAIITAVLIGVGGVIFFTLNNYLEPMWLIGLIIIGAVIIGGKIVKTVFG